MFTIQRDILDLLPFPTPIDHPIPFERTEHALVETPMWFFQALYLSAVWQPHTYSRTQTLFTEFSRAFKDADEVIVSEVYASREPLQEFTSAEIVSAMPHASARYIGTLKEISHYLIKQLQSGDVLLVLSAGDADQISTDVLAGLQER